ncbi:MAG: alpha/beta fold hydrolase [Nocardioidaceae bacterium]
MLWRTEPARAIADFVAFWAALPGLVPLGRGDGHGVLVVPGFMADDLSTCTLRTMLQVHGFRASGWSLGTNLGPTPHLWEGAGARLQELYAETRRPVTVIGQSLGGIFARELARNYPDLVRQVITLGSPYRLDESHAPELTTVGHIYHALRHLHTDAFSTPEEDLPPITAPATSVYSRADGVVPWQSCIETGRPNTENIEVSASHCGMSVHPEVMRIVLDRLRLPEGEWRPYSMAAMAS